MGDSEKDEPGSSPIQPPPVNPGQNLPDPDTQVLEEGVRSGDLQKTDE